MFHHGSPSVAGLFYTDYHNLSISREGFIVFQLLLISKNINSRAMRVLGNHQMVDILLMDQLFGAFV